MSVEYYNVDGKTRAFFGITHLNRLYYRFIGLIALIISLIGIKRKEKKWIVILAIGISLGAIFLTFVDMWKWMI